MNPTETPPTPGPLAGFISTVPPVGSYLDEPPAPRPPLTAVWTVVGYDTENDAVTVDVVEASDERNAARKATAEYPSGGWTWRATFGGRIHPPVSTADFGGCAYTDHREAGR